jgi:hypothetical protein
MMTMLLLSFGENIEIVAYFLWPALVMLGVHLREMASQANQRVSKPAMNGLLDVTD